MIDNIFEEIIFNLIDLKQLNEISPFGFIIRHVSNIN